MGVNFPTSLDTLTNPTATDYLNSPSHSQQHADANDICEALEAKVGIDSSSVSTSHDKILTVGWNPYSTVIPTLASTDDPTYILTFAGVDLTSIMSVGQKVKFTQNSATVYAIVTAISFSTDTTLTLYCGTDYDVLDTATYPISDFYFSPHKAPFGFPLAITKWAVELESAIDVSQATPTAGVWYNIGSLSLTIPIGSWNISYKVTAEAYDASGLDKFGKITLSTANNTESDASLSAGLRSSDIYAWIAAFVENQILLTSKTIYYLNMVDDSGNITTMHFRGDFGTTVIRAVCAYL